jgi:predicted nucleic acid-binding protein
MIKGTHRQIKDGLVKSIQDGLGAKFKKIYLDSWVAVAWLKWKLKNKTKPQVIDYLEKVVCEKIVSDLVKEELKIVSKRDFKKEFAENLWNEFLKSLNLKNIGNPLNLNPKDKEEYDNAHIKMAKSMKETIIVTGDKGMIKKDDIVWSYWRLRKECI